MIWPTIGAFILSLALAFSIRRVVMKDAEVAESDQHPNHVPYLLDEKEQLPPMPTMKTKIKKKKKKRMRQRDNDGNHNICPADAHRTKSDRISRTKISDHQFVIGTRDLLLQRGIVCPGQTLTNILHDDFTYTTPALWNNSQTFNGKKKTKPKPIVVFKRGGSGSTWFDSTLSAHPDVKFTHEVQKYFRPSDTPKDKTDLLVDYLTTDKIQDKYRGFSISPSKHGRDVDWTDLLERTGAALVVFIRTNVVKRRVGLLRKGMVVQLPKKCRFGGGGGHLKPRKNVTSGGDDDCSIGMTRFSEEDIDRLDGSNWLQTWGMLDETLALNVPFQVITFEGMQQSVSNTLRAFGLFAGWGDLAAYAWEEDKDPDVHTTKVTPEDLSQVLSNYEEVEREIKARGLGCYIDMLQAVDEQVFPLCRPHIGK